MCDGIPYEATEKEIRQFFEGFDLIEDSITFGKRGSACVLFKNEEAMLQAL